MKTLPILCGLFVSVIGCQSALAVHTETYSFSNINLTIPDNDSVGIADLRTLDTGIDSITDLNLSIRVSSPAGGDPMAFNGDLYIYLTHDTGLTILFNRIGKKLTEALGYADNGFDIKLDDEAVNSVDIHRYQELATPAPGMALTGIWRPDGRLIDPEDVLETDPRTKLLNSFNGMNADGAWTLFVADVADGADHQVESWSLEITGVPEPTSALLIALGGTVLLRRRRKSQLS